MSIDLLYVKLIASTGELQKLSRAPATPANTAATTNAISLYLVTFTPVALAAI